MLKQQTKPQSTSSNLLAAVSARSKTTDRKLQQKMKPRFATNGLRLKLLRGKPR